MSKGQQALLVGVNVEGYRVMRELIRARHHSVFQAEEVRGGSLVALKTVVIPPADEALAPVMESLADLQEVQAARHNSLLQILDSGIVEGEQTGHLAYLVMELLTQGTLTDLVGKKGPLDLGSAARIIWQVAGALHALHEAGVVHGAVTPGNIMLGAHGRSVVCEPAGQRLHRVLYGEPAVRRPEGIIYRAPEATSTDVNLNRRADVYSLGGLLFFLLTGKHPPASSAGKAPMENKQAVVDGSALPAAVRAVLKTAMAADRGDRHDGALKMAQALEAALQAPHTHERTHVTPEADAQPPLEDLLQSTLVAPPSTLLRTVVTPPPRVEDQDGATMKVPLRVVAEAAAGVLDKVVPPTAPMPMLDSGLELHPVEDLPTEGGFTEETPAYAVLLAAQQQSARLNNAPAPQSPPSFRPATPPATPPAMGHAPPSRTMPPPYVPPPSPPLATPAAQGGRTRTASRPPTMPPTLSCPGCAAPMASALGLKAHSASCPALQLAMMDDAEPMLVGVAVGPPSPPPAPRAPAAAPKPEAGVRHGTVETRCRHCGIFFREAHELESHLPRCSMKRQTFATVGNDAPLELARLDPAFIELDELGKQLTKISNRVLADMAGRGLEMLRDMVAMVVDAQLQDAVANPMRGRLLETGRRICIMAQDTTQAGIRQMNAQLDVMVRAAIRLQNASVDGAAPPGTVLDAASRAVLEMGPVNLVKRTK